MVKLHSIIEKPAPCHEQLHYMETTLAGHYQIVEPLGRGGFGQTFLAKDIHLPGNPLCVVKQLKPRDSDSATLATAQRLFEREAEMLYQLGEHDQIPRLLAHFEQDGKFYLVQEYIEDYDLACALSQSPLFKGGQEQENVADSSPTQRGQEGVTYLPFKKGGQGGDLADTLKLIQGALRLSAHILAKDKTQLAGQLIGRLLSFEMPDIQVLLRQAKPKESPWLRPLTPSLMPPGGALLRTLTGHTDAVVSVAVTPDSQRVISGSNDTTIKVWNLATGEELFTLIGHTKAIKAVAVTPDGNLLISGSSDKTLKVWNLATGEELFTLIGHLGKIQALAVTYDGKRVISAADDTTIKVWDLATGEELFALSSHIDSVSALALTPDGKRVISGSEDTTLKVWNLKAKKKERLTLIGHAEAVQAIAVTPNGKLSISGSDDTTLKVWHLKTAKELFTLTGHTQSVRAIAVIKVCSFSTQFSE